MRLVEIWAAYSRSGLTGVSMLVSMVILGFVVSSAYQLAGQRGDPGDPPLIGVLGLPFKLPPDALLGTTGPLRGEIEFERGPDRARPAPAGPLAKVERPLTPVLLPGPTTPALTVEYRVQLLATPDEAAARRAWDELLGRFGAGLSAYEGHIERADLGVGTVYRVQIGPFDALTAAQAKCDELKRQEASCFVLRVGQQT